MAKTAGSSGYSGTPLAKKLGIGPGTVVAVLHAPDDYAALLHPVPSGVSFTARASSKSDLVHLFAVERAKLMKELTVLRHKIDPATPVWVSWPKKASRVPTTITEDVIREVALPLGFVDVKVCAVSSVWSGLKLVVRKELR
jgi:hypothetical protein